MRLRFKGDSKAYNGGAGGWRTVPFEVSPESLALAEAKLANPPRPPTGQALCSDCQIVTVTHSVAEGEAWRIEHAEEFPGHSTGRAGP